MEELDLSKELQDFYEKNKDNKRLLSNNEIRKLLTSFWTTSNYKIFSKDELFVDNLEDIVFGFKNHVLFFTKKSIVLEVVENLKSKLIEYTFDEINFKINVKI